MMHGFGFSGYSWIWMIFNLVITVGVIVGVVWFVIWLVRRTGANVPSNINTGLATQSPREILQSRYARGEITREQYLEILEDLKAGETGS
jgi:putative membrane protein